MYNVVMLIWITYIFVFQLDYFGSSYKMWGDSNTNSEHIAHNILSQLFEEERTKSPALTNAL